MIGGDRYVRAVRGAGHRPAVTELQHGCWQAAGEHRAVERIEELEVGIDRPPCLERGLVCGRQVGRVFGDVDVDGQGNFDLSLANEQDDVHRAANEAVGVEHAVTTDGANRRVAGCPRAGDRRAARCRGELDGLRLAVDDDGCPPIRHDCPTRKGRRAAVTREDVSATTGVTHDDTGARTSHQPRRGSWQPSRCYCTPEPAPPR